MVRFASSSRIADRMDRSRPGSLGPSLYTWRSNDVEGLWKQVHAGGATQVTDVLRDEFGEYQEKTSRQIPVIILEPRD